MLLLNFSKLWFFLLFVLVLKIIMKSTDVLLADFEAQRK
jgi:hypothetical protein